jgi:prepilin-type processing-associated H-X9-DG protein
MGQVWSKADFDGVTGQGNQGGRGSCLAVTSQNPGSDGLWDTDDDVLEPLNNVPLNISTDASTTSTDVTNPLDRVRGYFSFHPGGANFVLGDGSVQFVDESINSSTYRKLSSMNGGEVVTDF